MAKCCLESLVDPLALVPEGAKRLKEPGDGGYVQRASLSEGLFAQTGEMSHRLLQIPAHLENAQGNDSTYSACQHLPLVPFCQTAGVKRIPK